METEIKWGSPNMGKKLQLARARKNQANTKIKTFTKSLLLENTFKLAERNADFEAQHGPVRVLVKDGKAVGI